MFGDPSETRINISNGSVTCISFGKGNKPLVMIPGLRLSGIEGSALILSRYYKIFADDYRVYVFDRTDRLPEKCTIHGFAEDLAEAMGEVGITDAYVFGASQGGMIAMDLAIDHPELVHMMVLGVTAAGTNDTIREVIGNWIEMARSGSMEDIAKDYTIKGFSERYVRKYKVFLPLAIKTQKLMPADRFIRLAEACLDFDLYGDLDRIKCPVLVLGGGCDRIVTGEASLEIADKLGCECYIYEDLSHEAYNEAKDFNRRIFEFFEKGDVFWKKLT